MTPDTSQAAETVTPIQTNATPSNMGNTSEHTTTTVKTATRTPRSMIVLLLLVLPPLAWFMMWRDKTYHHWFVKILIFSGMYSLIFLTFFYFSVGLQVNQLYASLGVKQPDEVFIQLSLLCSIVFSVVQIIFAFFLHQYLQKHPDLPKLLLLLSALFLIINLYVTMITPLSIVQSLYPAIYSLYQGSY